jgi:outer membrane protein, multidrug efflux system
MPPHRLRSLAWPLLAAALALSACTVGPDFHAPTPRTPAAWSATSSPASPSQAAPRPVPAAAWWTSFNDPELTSLIERAAGADLDLQTAALRITEARAQRDTAAAQLWPSLNGNTSWQSTLLSETTPTGKLFTSVGKSGLPVTAQFAIPNPYGTYQLGFDASWELDLFGHVRRNVEAAKANLAAAVEDSHDAELTLLGDVARVYIDLRGAQLKRAVTLQNVATLTDLMDLARQRRDAGLANDIDVARAAAQVTSATAGLPLIDRQIAADINQLSRLIDREPGALRTELETTRPVPPVPPQVPVGLPSDLARRRPDVRSAEARLHAATAQVGVAVAELYPRLTVQVNTGYQSEDIGRLLDWASRFSNLGPQVEVPIFDAGRRRATVRLQDARAREAAVDYARTVLGALHEVDNAVTTYDTEQTRRAALQATAAQDRTAVDLALARYKSGLASFLDVLDAERTQQQNELELADSTAAVSIDLVALYKALGGGWDAPELAAASGAAAR